jgi:hypothetical protein
MAGIPRLMVTNRIQATATLLSASSSATGAPVSRLKDQLRSKTWRSATGWVVVAGVNDKIDFNRGGVKVATIASATYATGAAKAAAIVTALEAADATPVWACAYDAGTKKFTISSDLAFTLLFASGANLATSVHVDLGFATADTTSAITHTADSVAYQSRHAITADLGAAASVNAAIVINHNAGAGGTFTFQADVASLAAVGYGDAATPDFSQALAGDTNIRIAFFSDPNRRYLRLLINDVQNVLGYGEVGVWFAGPYTQPTVSYSIGFTKIWEELSEVTVAISGAHFQDEKARRPSWGLAWSEVGESDRAALAAAFALVPKGRCFFLSFDAVTTPTDTEYGFLTEGVSEELTSGLYFNVPVPVFSGALG